jgi:prepilin-type N-terminal cleavage/methylation domain-containing protein
MTMNNKGFTLVEILIVVSILVVLGIAVLVGLNPMVQIFKGYDTRRKSDLKEIKIALENYYSDHDCYPAFPEVTAEGRPTYDCDSTFLSPYLLKMPCDPNSHKPYVVFLTPETATCPQQFAIYANITSPFDNSANSIPYCPDTVYASSPNTTQVNLITGCSDQRPCSISYGCVNFACVEVSDGEVSDCRYSWCEPDCAGLCGTAKFYCR